MPCQMGDFAAGCTEIVIFGLLAEKNLSRPPAEIFFFLDQFGAVLSGKLGHNWPFERHKSQTFCRTPAERGGPCTARAPNER